MGTRFFRKSKCHFGRKPAGTFDASINRQINFAAKLIVDAKESSTKIDAPTRHAIKRLTTAGTPQSSYGTSTTARTINALTTNGTCTARTSNAPTTTNHCTARTFINTYARTSTSY